MHSTTAQKNKVYKLINFFSFSLHISYLKYLIMTMQLSKQIIIVSWLLGLMIVGINIYFLSTSFTDWLLKSSLPKAGRIIIGIIVFPLMAIYIIAVGYLTLRKDTVVTFALASDKTPIEMEKGLHICSGDGENEVVPYREDLADIPFPE